MTELNCNYFKTWKSKHCNRKTKDQCTQRMKHRFSKDNITVRNKKRFVCMDVCVNNEYSKHSNAFATTPRLLKNKKYYPGIQKFNMSLELYEFYKIIDLVAYEEHMFDAWTELIDCPSTIENKYNLYHLEFLTRRKLYFQYEYDLI